jgi:hypothetical protein
MLKETVIIMVNNGE